MGKYLKEAGKIKKSFSVGVYTNMNGHLVRMKKEKEGEVPISISSYELEYVQKINNGVDTNQLAIKFKGIPEVSGLITAMPNILKEKGLVTIKGNEAKDFVGTMVASTEIDVDKRIDGGYGSLNDIPNVEISDKRRNMIQKRVIDYMNQYFTEEMMTAFRLLIVMPFYWILKNDYDVDNKGFLKGLSLYGWKDAGKTFVVTFTMNMFSTMKIPFSGSYIYSTFAGIKNDMRQILGILLIDECNNILKAFREPMNDFINAIINRKLPVQALEGGKGSTDYNYTCVPVFTSNDEPDFNNSNLERLNVINFTSEFKPSERFKLNLGHELLKDLGLLIADSFKRNYTAISECNNPLEASDIILKDIKGLDFNKIMCADKLDHNMAGMPVNLLVRQDLIRNDLFDDYGKTDYSGFTQYDWFYRVMTDGQHIKINLNKFYSYISELTGDTSRNYDEIITELHPHKTSENVGKHKLTAYKINTDLFDKWLTLTESPTNYLVEPTVTELTHLEIDPKFRLGDRWTPI